MLVHTPNKEFHTCCPAPKIKPPLFNGSRPSFPWIPTQISPISLFLILNSTAVTDKARRANVTVFSNMLNLFVEDDTTQLIVVQCFSLLYALTLSVFGYFLRYSNVNIIRWLSLKRGCWLLMCSLIIYNCKIAKKCTDISVASRFGGNKMELLFRQIKGVYNY